MGPWRRIVGIACLVGAMAWPLAPVAGQARTGGDGGSHAEVSEPVPHAILELGRSGDELIGVHITDDAVRGAIALIPEGRRPRVLILRINSMGGMLREVPDLVDLVTEEASRGTRVVAWVDTAISAAALTALGCGEIVMEPGGTLGAAVAFRREGGRPVALEGEQLERALAVGEEIARRTGRDPRIIRAMQTPTALSYDVGEDGSVELRSDAQGERPLADGETILTLNAPEAAALGVSIGTADDLDRVLALLGVEKGTDVGELAREQLRRHMLRASAALDRLIAYDASVRRTLRRAREADDDAARVAALDQLERTMRKLRREAARWPDPAAYIGVDGPTLEAYEAEIAELHRPVGGDD